MPRELYARMAVPRLCPSCALATHLSAYIHLFIEPTIQRPVCNAIWEDRERASQGAEDRARTGEDAVGSGSDVEAGKNGVPST